MCGIAVVEHHVAVELQRPEGVHLEGQLLCVDALFEELSALWVKRLVSHDRPKTLKDYLRTQGISEGAAHPSNEPGRASPR